MNCRPLKSNEIEVRVGTVNKQGATLLLYKNARVDMAILDETVGAANWQRDHKEIKGNLYCGIGIFNEDRQEWTWKWDCGVESNTEKEKGEASDSFKRAGVNWGIGRELYTGPKIQIKCPTEEYAEGKYRLKDKWYFWGAYVDDIAYQVENGNPKIAYLVIKDKNGAVIYEYKEEAKEERLTTAWQRKTFADMCEKANVKPEEILQKVGWESGTMTEAQYGKAIIILAKEINK